MLALKKITLFLKKKRKPTQKPLIKSLYTLFTQKASGEIPKKRQMVFY